MMFKTAVVSASALQVAQCLQTDNKNKTAKKAAKQMLVPMCFGLAKGAMADQVDDLKSYEKFDGSMCITSTQYTKANQLYPEKMQMTVPYQGEQLTLDLEVDGSIFADDWKLVDGQTGETITDDKEQFMCHYTGKVAGKPNSKVTISVCNDAGITGLIQTADYEAEIRPAEPNGEVSIASGHIIYNMDDLILPDDIHFGEAVAAFDDSMNQLMNTTEPGAGANRAYTMNLVTASDSARMSAQSSEASNTQSIVSQMNTRYTNTNWGSGNSLRIVLQRQIQNANMGGAPTSNLSNYLPRVASWKGSNYPNDDNVQGLTSFNQGGTIGVAYLRTMCQRSNSAGINNVGFTSSTSTRGILVAHEAGHNFAMNHDNSQVNVMSSSINSNAQRFTTQSVNEFLSTSPKTCL